MARRSLPLVVLAFLVCVSAAHATVSQTPDITNTHYSSILKKVYPQVAGVSWKVIDLSDEIEVINRSRETVTIYGYSQAQAGHTLSCAPTAPSRSTRTLRPTT
jgi:hypothetical protein